MSVEIIQFHRTVARRDPVFVAAIAWWPLYIWPTLVWLRL